MKIQKSILDYKKIALFIILILHFVGLYQIVILDNKELMESSSIIILISFILFIVPEIKNWKTIFIPFSMVYLIGWTSELIGVNTSLLFGEYSYGDSLGLKLFNTPLTIGILWLSLSIGIKSILIHFSSNKVVHILLGATALLLFDVLLEPVAISFGMWEWVGGDVPIYNYICWFVISLIMQIVLMNYNNSKSLFKYSFFINIAFFSFLYSAI